MSNVQLVGKVKGTFENHDFYQLIFLENVGKDKGEGFKPFVSCNSRGVYSCFVGCTQEAYFDFILDKVYDTSKFLFNSKRKLVGYLE